MVVYIVEINAPVTMYAGHQEMDNNIIRIWLKDGAYHFEFHDGQITVDAVALRSAMDKLIAAEEA